MCALLFRFLFKISDVVDLLYICAGGSSASGRSRWRLSHQLFSFGRHSGVGLFILLMPAAALLPFWRLF